MGGIGEQLRRARQEKGLTLHEVEEATKIRLKYLNALEEEAFDELPGRVYAIGFLRNYARYLGLDAEELVRQLKEIVPLPQEEPLRGFTPGHELTVSRRRWQRLLIAGLVILALIGFNKIYYLTRSLDQPPAPSQPPYNSSPVEPLKPPGSREVPPSPAESSRVAGVK
ncbi:MAG: hypothetical protein PWP65_1296, partial [Clostridia bacterium]|nr:hypothetical protein [Clostridia bacterium]